MNFRVEETKGVVVISLEGEMVGSPVATLLTEKLHELIEEGKTRIVVDMERVHWMNSSGLGILIGGLTTVRNSGGDLKLACLGKKLQDLLRLTKLDRVFEAFKTTAEAVDSFSG